MNLAALGAWSVQPQATASGVLLLLAGLGSAARLARWQGLRTLKEPLVWVLHLGHLWLAAGLLLLGLASLQGGLATNNLLHALTTGAIGTMTLAVMTRASLGHSGRALTAGVGTTAIYILIALSAALRVSAAFWAGDGMTLIGLSALCWSGAFGLFVLLYGPLLLRPQRPAPTE